MTNLDQLQKTDRTEPRSLRCALTRDEVRDRGESFAALSEKLDEKIEERKAIAKELAEEIEILRSEGAVLRQAVRNHTEFRSVDCSWYIDWMADEIVLVRTDTQEEVERKPIPEDFRQLDAFE